MVEQVEERMKVAWQVAGLAVGVKASVREVESASFDLSILPETLPHC